MKWDKKKTEILVAVLVIVAIILIVYFAVIKPNQKPLVKTGMAVDRMKTALEMESPESAGGPTLNQEGFGNILKDSIGAEDFAAHRLHRDHMARGAQRRRSELLRSNPEQMSAREARMLSVRGVDKFGGPRAGYGWSPSPADDASPGGGWHDGQSSAHNKCTAACAENCNGPACETYCEDRCRDTAILQATA